MNLKIRLVFKDVVKILFGGSVVVSDSYNKTIYRLQKGKDTYITKG